jgi:hypothetical protein
MSRCWEGYKPVPGKKPYSEGSCVKKTEVKPNSQYVKVRGSDDWHEVKDIKDSGKPAHLGGGNNYHLITPSGKEKIVHQDHIADHAYGSEIDLSKSEKPFKGYKKGVNHEKGGLSRKEAKKHGIHAGVETDSEIKKKGGVSNLSDKTSARRRSFCARHCGMKRKFPDAYKDPKSKGNAALRVWHCGSCSSWLKKSIGVDDKVEFYQSGDYLHVFFAPDVPHEIEDQICNNLKKSLEEC